MRILIHLSIFLTTILFINIPGAWADYTLEERILDQLYYSCDQYCSDEGVQIEFGTLKIAQMQKSWNAILEFKITRLGDGSFFFKECSASGKIQEYMEDLIYKELDACVGRSL